MLKYEGFTPIYILFRPFFVTSQKFNLNRFIMCLDSKILIIKYSSK